MVGAPTVEKVEITAMLPADLLREIDAIAEEERVTRDMVLAAGAKRYINGLRRWQAVQAVASERARALGILTEDDVEDLVDSVSE